jgi:chemotaxis protein MotA
VGLSISTVIALVSSLAIFIGAIMLATNEPMIFVHWEGFVMVLGGTLAATFLSYETRYVIIALKLIWRMLFAAGVGRNILKAEVGRVIRWAYSVQKGGLPALEAEAARAVRGDKFMKFGIEMVISGYTGDEIRDILHTTIETTFGRNTVPVNILKFMAGAAPAFGMIATLVGLVIMLSSMGGDPTQLGKGLAVGLLGTLYGVVSARFLFMPASAKIMQREQILRFRNFLVAEGLALLADRKSPRFIQDKMNSFLDPAIHFNIDKMKE